MSNERIVVLRIALLMISSTRVAMRVDSAAVDLADVLLAHRDDMVVVKQVRRCGQVCRLRV